MVNEQIIQYKKLLHRGEAECNKLTDNTKGKNKKKLILSETQKHFGDLGIIVPEIGTTQHSSGEIRGEYERVTYDLHLTNISDEKRNINYKLFADYKNEILSLLNFIIEAKNYHNAGKKYFVGVDVSKGFTANFTGEYKKDNDVLRLSNLNYGMTQLISDFEDTNNQKVLASSDISCDTVSVGPFKKVLMESSARTFELLKVFVDDSVLFEFPHVLRKNPVIHI